MNAPTYTTAQYQAVLASVAMSTLSLNRLVMLAQEAEGEELVWLLDAAQHLAQHIGGMADGAIGGQVLGTAEVWSHGPRFLEMGAEAEPAACNGCPARWTDTAPVDFFDRQQEQGRIAIRTACSVTCKPCMKGGAA